MQAFKLASEHAHYEEHENSAMRNTSANTLLIINKINERAKQLNDIKRNVWQDICHTVRNHGNVVKHSVLQLARMISGNG